MKMSDLKDSRIRHLLLAAQERGHDILYESGLEPTTQAVDSTIIGLVDMILRDEIDFYKNKEHPILQDAGKQIEILMSSGKIATGTLYVADDEFYTGEDEVPVFRVRMSDGVSVPFVDYDYWRFVD